jgi:DNA/RNA endonuclease G (NUC1)
VAPQFQSFNNGNWKALEMATRDYAESKKEDVTVYTGMFGQTKYKVVKTITI